MGIWFIFGVLLGASQAGPTDAGNQFPDTILVQWVQEGDYVRAEAALRQVIATRAKPVHSYLLGVCLKGQFRYDEAAVAMKQAIADRADRPLWLNDLADCLSRSGRFRDAMTYLERAIALKPEPRFCYNLAMCALSAGLPEAAEAALRQTLALDPDHKGALFKLGELFLNSGEPELATELLRRAAALDGDRVEVWFTLGRAQLLLGRKTEAEAAFGATLERAPQHLGAHYNLARLLAGTGRRDQAKVHFDRFKELQPLQEAIENSLKFVQTAPGNSVERVNLGLLLIKAGRVEEALEPLEAAVRLAPAEAAPLTALAKAYRLLGRAQDATRAERLIAELTQANR